MAKGYIVDEELRCVRFRVPGGRNIIRCSFNTLAQSFGAALPSQAEDALFRIATLSKALRNASYLEADRATRTDGYGFAPLIARGRPRIWPSIAQEVPYIPGHGRTPGAINLRFSRSERRLLGKSKAGTC